MVVEYANQTISTMQCEARIAQLDLHKLAVRLHAVRMKVTILTQRIARADAAQAAVPESLRAEAAAAAKQVQTLTVERKHQQEFACQKRLEFYTASEDLCHWRYHLDFIADSQLLPNWESFVGSNVMDVPASCTRRRAPAGVVKRSSGVCFSSTYYASADLRTAAVMDVVQSCVPNPSFKPCPTVIVSIFQPTAYSF